MNRLAWCLLPVVAACAASSPGDEGPEGLGDPADAGVVEVDLQIDALPPTTPYGSIPVGGRGPAGGKLMYKVPVQDAAHADIANDGSFCVDVPIEKGTATEIEFQAIDADGNYSTPVKTTITQAGTPPVMPEPDVSEARNFLRGAIDLDRPTTLRTSTSLDDGESYDVLTDGNTSAAIHVYDESVWAWSNNWIAIHIPERAKIFGAKITGTCDFGDFVWMLSNEDDPVDPDDSWSTQAYVTEYKSTHTLAPAVENQTAKWIAFRFDSRDCAGFTDGYGYRMISEIELYTYDGIPGAPDELPTNGAPTCANGRKP
jgi:hypothetical protein